MLLGSSCIRTAIGAIQTVGSVFGSLARGVSPNNGTRAVLLMHEMDNWLDQAEGSLDFEYHNQFPNDQQRFHGNSLWLPYESADRLDPLHEPLVQHGAPVANGAIRLQQLHPHAPHPLPGPLAQPGDPAVNGPIPMQQAPLPVPPSVPFLIKIFQDHYNLLKQQKNRAEAAFVVRDSEIKSELRQLIQKRKPLDQKLKEAELELQQFLTHYDSGKESDRERYGELLQAAHEVRTQILNFNVPLEPETVRQIEEYVKLEQAKESSEAELKNFVEEFDPTDADWFSMIGPMVIRNSLHNIMELPDFLKNSIEAPANSQGNELVYSYHSGMLLDLQDAFYALSEKSKGIILNANLNDKIAPDRFDVEDRENALKVWKDIHNLGSALQQSPSYKAAVGNYQKHGYNAQFHPQAVNN